MRYAEVVPGADLVYRVTGAGVEELLVVKSAGSTAAVSFVVEGVDLVREPVGLRGSGDSRLARRVSVSAPESFTAEGLPVDVAAQVFTLEPLGKGVSRVTVGLAEGATREMPAEAFPVVVDPSVNVNIGTSSVVSYANYLSNGSSYASYNDGYARVGNPYLSSTSTVRWRSVAFMDYSAYYGASVLDAWLTTNTVEGSGAGTRWLNAFWAHQWGFHYSVAPRYLTAPPSLSYANSWAFPYLSSTLGMGVQSHYGSDLDTLYNAWTINSATGGAVLLQGEEQAAYTFKKFAVSVWLTVNRPPSTPTLVSPANGASSHNLTQTLTATTATDADNDPLTYQFYWCPDSACTVKNYFAGLPTVAGSNVSQTVTFPTNSFGQTLYWGVRVTDGITAPKFSSSRSIAFTNHAPTAMLTSPVNGAVMVLASGVAGQPPTLAATVADADDLVVNYRFELTPASGSGVVAASPWASATQPALGAGAGVSFQIPAWLDTKGSYTWKVKVSDTNGASGESSSFALNATSRLGADSASPMQPMGPVAVNLATGNLFAAAGSAKAVHTVGGPVSVSFAYNSQDTSTVGMRGTYYVDSNSNGSPDSGEVKMVRTDSLVSFNWGSGSPGEAVPVDNFKVRWEGFFQVPQAGQWRFAGGHDDALKVTVTVNAGAPQVVYDQGCCRVLGDPAAFSSATAVTLDPGDVVKVQVDYTEATGFSWLDLRATVNGGAEVIPQFTTNAVTLPTGWTFSADTGIAPLWASAEIGLDTVTLTAIDGSQYAWTKSVPVSGVVSWVPPFETDDVLSVNSNGTVTVHGSDGLVYEFSTAGVLVEVTTVADSLKPAGAKYVYSSGTNTSLPTRLIRLEDRLASTRWIKLYYNQPGLDSGCPAPLAGMDAAAPAGMLCAVEYPDGTWTRLYYQSGLLARISDPGDESDAAAGVTAAPEGRAVTDLRWTSGRLTTIVTAAENDRINAQVAGLIPTGQHIPINDLATTVAWTGDRVATVTSPRPAVGEPRPAATITYGTLTSSVSAAGLPVTARTVTFDVAGRVLTDTDSVGRTTSTVWATSTDAVLKTTSGGRTTSTVYDPDWHPITTWGPALSTCFTTSAPPVGAQWQSYPSNGTCEMPRSTVEYDHNLSGLTGTIWSNTTRTGTPAAYSNAPGSSINYNDTRAAYTSGWSARYTGLLFPPSTGTYTLTFYTANNTTASLWLDDINYGNLTGTQGTAITRTFTAGDPVRVRLDVSTTTTTENVSLWWVTPAGGAAAPVPNTVLKPGFWYATRTTSYDTAGSSQVPATTVTDTRFDEGIDPAYGIATSTTVDVGGLALKSKQGFEAPGTGSLLRRVSRTLPAYAAATPTTANSTTYSFYGDNETRANPCVAGSPAVSQAGLLKLRTDPTPAAGPAVATETVYDILGRAVAVRYVGAATWTCTSFDSRGRVTQVVVPQSDLVPAGRTVTTTYRVGGDPYTTAVTDPAGTVTTTVDAVGRTVKTVDVWGVTTVSVYDQLGRLTTATTTIGAHTAVNGYTYDNAGRVTTQTLNGQPIATMTYSPDNDPVDPGKLTSVSYPSGAGNAGNGTTGTVSYDTLGRTVGLTWTGPGGTITSNTVTRALSGRVLTDTVDGTIAWTYTYDGVGRLTRATGSGHDFQYGYAPSGGCGANTAAGANSNRTSLIDNGTTIGTYCYDNADRLTSTTHAGYGGAIAYDARGNTISLAGQTFTYDYANRNTGVAVTGTTVAYGLDAADRIVARTENGTEYRFGYTGAGDSSSYTLTTANTVIDHTISLPGGASVNVTAGLWSYPNIHGDVTAIANTAGIKQGATVTYDPFGSIIAGSTPDNLAGEFDNTWVGEHNKRLEHAPGLQPAIQMGARPYDPALGRFLEIDPIEGGTANDYAYVFDPVNDFDLTGMCAWYQKSGGWTDVWTVYRNGVAMGTYRPGDNGGSLTRKAFIATFTPAMKAKGFTARITGRREICISFWNTLEGIANGAGQGLITWVKSCPKGAYKVVAAGSLAATYWAKQTALLRARFLPLTAVSGCAFGYWTRNWW